MDELEIELEGKSSSYNLGFLAGVRFTIKKTQEMLNLYKPE